MSGLRTTGVEFRRADAAAAFGRVAVLHGGDSAEREISLLSGRAALAALRRRGIDAEGFDPQGQSLHALAEGGFSRVFIALHGPGGEDGAMQGALEWLGLRRVHHARDVARGDFLVLDRDDTCLLYTSPSPRD